MVREPTTRTVSSWHFHPSVSFSDTVRNGIAETAALEGCYARATLSPSELFRRVHDEYVAAPPRNRSWTAPRFFDGSGCTNALIAGDDCRKNGRTGYCSHVGKSLYAHTLVHWVARVPRHRFHILALETFAEDPVAHYAALLQFLGLDLLDDDAAGVPRGFASLQAAEDTLKQRFNSRTLDPEVYAKEVEPSLPALNALFHVQNKHLALLVAGDENLEGSQANATSSWDAVRHVLYKTNPTAP